MLSDTIIIKQVLSVDIKLLADDGNEYIYSLHDFSNIENSEISISNDTGSWHNSSTIGLYIACNGYTSEFTKIK